MFPISVLYVQEDKDLYHDDVPGCIFQMAAPVDLRPLLFLHQVTSHLWHLPRTVNVESAWGVVTAES